MVNDWLPVLLMVKVRSALEPTPTLPKLSVVGLTSHARFCTQVPETLTGLQLTEPQELLVLRLIVPLGDPAVVQLSRTVTITLPPAGTVAGNAGSMMVNAGLLELIALMVNDVLPVLLTVKLWSAVEPVKTVPKFSVVGLTAQAACRQTPETLTEAQLTEPQALLVVRLMVPLCAPGEPQLNRTVTITLPPGDSVAGNAGPTMLNAGLLELIALMVNDTLPVLLTVKV
jgi:hypothetical protein